jgi:hypothetical protein
MFVGKEWMLSELDGGLEKFQALVEQQDIPEEEAAVRTVGALNDWYGQQPKKHVQGDSISWPLPENGWLAVQFQQRTPLSRSR